MTGAHGGEGGDGKWGEGDNVLLLHTILRMWMGYVEADFGEAGGLRGFHNSKLANS